MAPSRQWKRHAQSNTTNMSKSKYRKLSTLLLRLNDKMDTMECNWNQKFDQLSSNVVKNETTVDARKIEPQLAKIQNHVKEVSRELDLTISMCQKSKDIEVVPEVKFSLAAFQFRKKVDAASGSDEPMLESSKKAVSSIETQTSEFHQTKTPKLSYCDGRTQTSDTMSTEEPAPKKSGKSNSKPGNVKSRLFDDMDDDVFDKETDSPFREKSPERLALIEQEIFKSRSRIQRSPLNGASNRTPRYEPLPALVRDELRSPTFINIAPRNQTIPSAIGGANRKRASTLPISSRSTYFKGTPPIRSKDFSLVTSKKTGECSRQIVGNNTLVATGINRSDTFRVEKQHKILPSIEKGTVGNAANETFSVESSSKTTRDDAATKNDEIPTTSDRNKETSHVVTSTSGNSDRKGSSTSTASRNTSDDQEETNARPSSTSSLKSLVGASIRRPSSTASPTLFKSGVKTPSRIISTPVFVVSRQEPLSIPGPSNANLDANDISGSVTTPVEEEGPSIKKRRKVTSSKPVSQRYNFRSRTNPDKTG